MVFIWFKHLKNSIERANGLCIGSVLYKEGDYEGGSRDGYVQVLDPFLFLTIYPFYRVIWLNPFYPGVEPPFENGWIRPWLDIKILIATYVMF